MFALLIVLFFMFFSLFHLSNFRALLSLSILEEERRKIRVVEIVDLGVENIYSGVVTSNGSLLVSDVSTDVLFDNCFQGIIQVCQTLRFECGNSITNGTTLWAWALSAVGGDRDALEYGIDFILTNNPNDNANVVIPLSLISNVTSNPPDCNSLNNIIRKGRFYYTTRVRPLNCDAFSLDLNHIRNDIVSCAYSDILKR